jgi:arylsulfatase A-like enzyme
MRESAQKRRRHSLPLEDGVRRQKRAYYAAITEMDISMGKVLAELDRLGLRETTYVFLMGDNGWLQGEHGFSSKVLPYEPSLRVPFLAAGRRG